MRPIRIISYLFSNSKRSVLICPDKFKFSMSAGEVSQAIGRNLPKGCNSKILGLADGGQGSLDVISNTVRGEWIECPVFDPLFRTITATYFVTNNQESYIEMAKASGLQLLQTHQRNPLQTTSYGTGQLIFDSIKRRHSKINLLIGGSATNDGGIGLANALGYSFKDKNGVELKPIGRNLSKIESIEMVGAIESGLNKSQISVYTDVTNIFTGVNGATRVYGPQKGAKPSQIQQLEQGMNNLRQVFINKYKIDLNKVQGSGAAGGVGGLCSILLNSKLKRGIDLMFTISNFQSLVRESDLIITGQGKVDGQTMKGKVVKGVLEAAKRYNKKVLILCAFCQNLAQIQSKAGSNVELIQLLSASQRQIINPELTKKRIEQAIQQYFAPPL